MLYGHQEATTLSQGLVPGWGQGAVRARLRRCCGARHVQLAVCAGDAATRDGHRLPLRPHQGHPQRLHPRAQRYEGGNPLQHH